MAFTCEATRPSVIQVESVFFYSSDTRLDTLQVLEINHTSPHADLCFSPQATASTGLCPHGEIDNECGIDTELLGDGQLSVRHRNSVKRVAEREGEKKLSKSRGA